MRFCALDLPRADEAELIDHAEPDRAVLAENLADLRWINRRLGGIQLTNRVLEHWLGGLPAGTAVQVLDLATGSADLPEAMLAWARERGLRMRLVATDVSERILRLARHQASSAMEFAVADAGCLPFASQSFDLVTCSLVLHHLNPDAAVAMLCEMSRIARRGVVVNDLTRSRLAYWGAELLCRQLSTNPLTRHDGPLSVRRAYTRDEITDLLARAGLAPSVTFSFFGWRLAVCAADRSF